MNKEIKFSIKIDDTEFDQKVKQMAQKVKGAFGFGNQQTPGNQPGGAAGSDPMVQRPAMEAFFKSMQALRTNQDTAMRNHAKEQMKLMKDIAKEEERRGKLLQDQEKISKNKNKDLQEELRIKKELKTTEEQINRLTNQAGSSKTSFQAARQAAMGVTQPVFVTNWPGGPGGGGGGGGGQGGGPGGGGGGKNFWSGLGKSLGTAAALLATGATLIDQYTSLPMTQTSALGNATQSIVGGSLQELASGNVVQSAAWMKEKERASQMASKKMQSQQVTDSMNVLGGGLNLVTGGGLGSDRAATMLMGSISKAMSEVLSVSMKGSIADKLSVSLGKASEEYFSTHQAQLMEDFGKNYENMLQAQQKENPLKNLAVNYFQDRYKTDLQSQRMMGMGDKEFYGPKGFLEQANLAGFTGDMAMQSAQQIQAAGGSTRGMRGNSLLALKAQRGFDMTNAGSVLGTISGGAGSAEASERIFRKILEEGVKNGLDNSEAVEELRRFSQQTAEVVAKTGAVTGEDAQRIIENFSRFQAGGIPTTREQEGARAAYQEAQGFSSETGGRGGAMQFASMMKRGMSKVGFKGMAGLMEMPEEDLTTTNPYVVAMAVKAGMTPSELVRQTINSKREKAQVEAGFNPNFQKTLDKAGITKELTHEELMAQPKDVQEAYIAAQEAATVRSKYETSQKRSGVVRGFLTGGQLAEGAEVPTGTTPAGARVEGGLEEPPGNRSADEVVKAAGVAAQAMLENFREFKTEITPASDALDIFTKRLVLLTQVMGMTPEKDRAAAAKYVGEHAYMTPMSAQQAGKPKPGSGSSGSW